MATALYPLMQKFIHDEWIKLESTQITPWAFLKTHFGKVCTDFQGRDIAGGGMEYQGSIVTYFRSGYIEPFLEDLICRGFLEARRLGEERRQSLEPILREMGGLLMGTVRKAYARMAEIDQRLRGNGYPSSVPRYDFGDERS
ncbi:MAG TPA: hypothetical protein VEW04_01440, partial [Allosphingosinicella sp.]|nr:hypothetical protein [Allosphingosinicella sp.]